MDREEKVLIIAEAGVNYNGDIELAKKMVKVAAQAGADIVKFQTGIPENVISKYAEKADYLEKNPADADGEESQLEMARKLMLPWSVYPELINYCKEQNIQFLSTPFDIPSATYLHELGMTQWKIPSGEITNLPFLRHVAGYGQPIILSTGMSTLEEVAAAMSVLQESGAGKITLLQCNTDYPTAYEDANIRAMLSLKEKFKVSVGYSDHTMGLEVPVAAVALGATVIEKHFTLDRGMEGPDQVASMEPDELKQMVQAIRNVEKALGTGEKVPSKAESKNIAIARKSIVAAKAIKCGEVYTEDNLACKRPGTGISPMEWDEMIGKRANRDYEEDELIER